MNSNELRIMVEGKNFVAWATDAHQILGGKGGDPRRHRDWIRDLYLVSTLGLTNFENSDFYSIASPRGHGKSLIIARKAVKMLDADTYVTLRPTTPFVNELSSQSIPIPNSQLVNLGKTDNWIILWKCTLLAHFACMSLRQKRVPDQTSDDTIKLLFQVVAEKGPSDGELSFFEFVKKVWIESVGHVESISPALTLLIKRGVTNKTLENWIEQFKQAYLRGRPELTYTIYIDALDEALGNTYGASLTSEAKYCKDLYKAELIKRVWLSAQKGLLVAVTQIHRDYSLLKAYASIRIEAIKNLKQKEIDQLGTTESKARGSLFAELVYTDSEMKQIFETNIRWMEDADLVLPCETDPAKRLFGFSKIAHEQVYAKNEEIFQLLLRHTFGSPRDLVEITKQAWACATASERAGSCGLILEAVDGAAAQICRDWLRTVVPVYDDDQEEEDAKVRSNASASESEAALNSYKTMGSASLQIPRNVIHSNKINEIEAMCEYPTLFSRLYSRGLVGFPVRDAQENKMIMHFHTPDGEECDLPKSIPYLALHPAFSAHLCREKKKLKMDIENFYSHEFIVGKGYECPRVLGNYSLILDITRLSESHLIINSDLGVYEIDLQDEKKFMPSSTYDRRNSARKLLSCLMLAIYGIHDSTDVEHNDLLAEMDNFQAVGLLTKKSDIRKFRHVLEKTFQNLSRSDLIKEINLHLKNTGLVLHHSRGGDGSSASVCLCLRDDPEVKDYHAWHRIHPERISCQVSQIRRPS